MPSRNEPLEALTDVLLAFDHLRRELTILAAVVALVSAPFLSSAYLDAARGRV